MELGLEKQINNFYNEMEADESCDLANMACNLVPKLVSKIRELEKRIDSLTSDSHSSDNEKENLEVDGCNGKWMYQLGESYLWQGEDYDTKEEAIKYGLEEKKEEESTEKLRIGQVEFVSPSGVDIDFILENVAENTTNDLAEVGEDYLYDVAKEHSDELEQQFNDILFEWMDKYGYKPNFYRIVNEEEIKESDKNEIKNI